MRQPRSSSRSAVARTRLALAACGALLSCVAVAAEPHRHAPASAAAPAGPVDIALDAAALAGLPRARASGEAHGRKLDCEGVALHALLRQQGAMPNEPLRGAGLARVVVVRARDGYRAVFSLAELDPSLGAREVLLADRCNGAALGSQDGPWRLIAPAESRPARWVRQVESIRVVDAP
ncbi:hypothetical protein K4L06_11130 [Lysobacter sp. BMK333-48F3]|uniref:hypothetical protein n=1 Tax=Lysobacter sp. BMK333-48F3 TaxID=2867962 RepID=UPI001C8BF82F|nr:hypothetical protein [Lysobacter sp. BMK333-48F3]MBX9401862.1 hypothetical protein [Lysobacter sp. BMK333-48F3]